MYQRVIGLGESGWLHLPEKVPARSFDHRARSWILVKYRDA